MNPLDHTKYPLWTALVTPLTADGEVDRNSLKGLLRKQEAADNALLLLGSTGESLNMSTKDRMKVLSIAFESVPTVPVMVGLGGSNLAATLEWMEYLKKLPIHAYLAVVPPYARPGSMGQIEWFRTLLEASDRPVIIYNVPSRAGCSLSTDALKTLAVHPRLQGIKEAGGSTESFRRYFQIAPTLTFYSGDDPLLPEFIPLGAKGLISVASNVWPGETRSYCQQALAGKLSSQEQTLWKECSELLFCAGNPVTVKHLLWKTGQMESPRCLPPLSCREDIPTSQLLEAHQKIQDWYRT